MANEYDKIIKENIEAVFIPLTKKLLHIESNDFEDISTNLHRTIERFPDFLKRVRHSESFRDFILHIEFQSTDDPQMQLRMFEYHALLARKFQIPILQQVFYLGPGISKMKNSLDYNNLSYKFELLSIQSIPLDEYMNSKIPEEIILSILCNFGNLDPEKVVKNIISRISELDISLREKQKTVNQLEILSKLRNLDSIVESLINKVMILNLDIKDDIRFKKGFLEGEAIGEAKGEAKGEAIGEAKGEAKGEIKIKNKMIKALLKKGKLSIEEIAEVAEVTVEYVMEISLNPF
jgi:predicted transposase YdaD